MAVDGPNFDANRASRYVRLRSQIVIHDGKRTQLLSNLFLARSGAIELLLRARKGKSLKRNSLGSDRESEAVRGIRLLWDGGIASKHGEQYVADVSIRAEQKIERYVGDAALSIGIGVVPECTKPVGEIEI